MQDCITLIFGWVGYIIPDNSEFAPKIIRQPRSSIIFDGRTQTVKLECEARGKPEPNYRWLVIRNPGTPPEDLRHAQDPRYIMDKGALTITVSLH